MTIDAEKGIKQVNFINIPNDLQSYNQWVAWKAEPNANGKPTKIPVDPNTGKNASTNNPSTWGTFEEAKEHYLYHEGLGIAGIGFVFTKYDPFCGVDLDNCRDPNTGQFDDWAEDILKDLSSYCEISPSDTGVKVFIKGSLPSHGRNSGNVEIYDTGRFFTLTGATCNGYPVTIEDRQAQIAALYNRYSDEKQHLLESGEILEGTRNNTLTSIGGGLRAQGMDYDCIYQELLSVNVTRCVPPLPEDEIKSIAESVSAYPAGENLNDRNKNLSQKLIELTDSLELFHTSDGETYAEIRTNNHKEIFQIKSNSFQDYLSLSFFEQYGNAPGSHALKNATGVLNAKARLISPEKEVHVRVAPGDNIIYLDLCNESREVVEITPTGWEIVNNQPVYFRRANGRKALPKPIRGGRIKDLADFINVKNIDEWVLIISWLFFSFRPKGPYPILILHGEQGSAKSTTAKMLRDLIDPSSSQLRTLQKSDRELMISAKNGWVIAYDNLSGISKESSDRLCRLSTGAGFTTRGLYTDSDEIIFNAARPVILNGIDDIANRNDLADRSLIVNLPRIPDHKRKTEDQIWSDFDRARPKILGALLDAVSCSLKNSNSVKIESKPRMADFTNWVVAAESKLPWKSGQFLEVYMANREESAMISFESDIVAITIKEFIENVKRWEGTTSELKGQLENFVEDPDLTKDKYWPKRPNHLSNRIRRIAPSLRSAGIYLNDKKIRGMKHWTFYLDGYEGADAVKLT